MLALLLTVLELLDADGDGAVRHTISTNSTPGLGSLFNQVKKCTKVHVQRTEKNARGQNKDCVKTEVVAKRYKNATTFSFT